MPALLWVGAAGAVVGGAPRDLQGSMTGAAIDATRPVTPQLLQPLLPPLPPATDEAAAAAAAWGWWRNHGGNRGTNGYLARCPTAKEVHCPTLHAAYPSECGYTCILADTGQDASVGVSPCLQPHVKKHAQACREHPSSAFSSRSCTQRQLQRNGTRVCTLSRALVAMARSRLKPVASARGRQRRQEPGASCVHQSTIRPRRLHQAWCTGAFTRP